MRGGGQKKGPPGAHTAAGLCPACACLMMGLRTPRSTRTTKPWMAADHSIQRSGSPLPAAAAAASLLSTRTQLW